MRSRSTLMLVALVTAVAALAALAPAVSSAPTDPPVYVLKWGTGGEADGEFTTPTGVAVAPDGRVYVADRDNDRIQRFSNVGRFELVFGSTGTGNGQFRDPRGLAVDTLGNVYVAEVTNDRIQVFNANGGFITSFGGPGAANGEFNNPSALAFAPNGDLYVADTDNDRIQRFENDGDFVSTFGIQGTGNLEFNDPEGVAVDSAGNIYVADTGNNRIQKISPLGVFLDEWGSTGTADGLFNAPRGLAVDSTDTLWVADSLNHRVQTFTAATGTFLSTIGSSGQANGNFDVPRSVGVDQRNDRVFVADTGNERIQKIGPQVDFDDVAVGTTFYEEISWIAAGAYATGFTSTLPPTVPGSYYRPTANITRQAMSAFMFRLAGSPTGTFPDPGFPDVPVDHVFFHEISWLAHTGITGGYNDGTYKPNRSITREAMAAFMFRYRNSPTGSFPNPGFSDVATGDVFYTEIAWAADAGVVDGFVDGTFRPTQPVTRQAMASFLFGLSEIGPPVI